MYAILFAAGADSQFPRPVLLIMVCGLLLIASAALLSTLVDRHYRRKALASLAKPTR